MIVQSVLVLQNLLVMNGCPHILSWMVHCSLPCNYQCGMSHKLDWRSGFEPTPTPEANTLTLCHLGWNMRIMQKQLYVIDDDNTGTLKCKEWLEVGSCLWFNFSTAIPSPSKFWYYLRFECVKSVHRLR